MNKDTGGPAFPTKRRIQRAGYLTDEYEPCGGMSLRDWFATHATEEDIKALRSLVPKVAAARNNYGPGPAFHEDCAEPKNWRQVARYLHADMMLKARQA